jgi:3-hydroxypropanoate dehydrogenase
MTASVTDQLAIDAATQELLFSQARTANAFTDEPVSQEQVRAIHELVKYGPTAMNSQPLRVLLVRGEQARERLVAHMSGNNQAKTRTAPLVAVLAADTDFHEQLHHTFPHLPGARDYFLDDAAREQNARFNAALQAAYFIVGVRAAGLAAGPMAGYDGPGIDAEFFPDGKLRTILVVNIGRPAPDAWFDRLPRLDYADVVTEV